MHTLTQEEKRQYIIEMGQALISTYGTQNYYSPEEVEATHRKTTQSPRLELEFLQLDLSPVIEGGIDLCHAALSLFSSPIDFQRYSESIGTVADYAATQAKFLQDLSLPTIVDSIQSSVAFPDFAPLVEQKMDLIGDTAGEISENLEGVFDSGAEFISIAAESSGDTIGGFFEFFFAIFD
ncbi:MAG: hypothetical protein AAF696_19015 [Bacteroidota bacterium]